MSSSSQTSPNSTKDQPGALQASGAGLSHYRKLPRLTPDILLAELSKRSPGLADAEEDRFARDDRDYKPLMFGKRNPDYQPSMFGR